MASSPDHVKVDAKRSHNVQKVKEYVMGCKLRQVQIPDGMQWVVCWYEYGPQKDTVESVAHIFQRSSPDVGEGSLSDV